MQFYCQKSIWPKKDTKLCLDVASVVGINFGNVKSSRILTFFDASRRYFVSITFTAYVSEYSSYQWLPEGKNRHKQTSLLIRSTWMHPCVVGVLVAHMCFSFSLFVSSRSLCYFCSTVWLHYLIYDFLFIPQFFLPFHIIFVHFSLFFLLLTFFFFHILS